jgi:predicted porin
VISGFQFGVGYAGDKTTAAGATTTDVGGYTLAVAYTAGPLSAAVVYGKAEIEGTAGATSAMTSFNLAGLTAGDVTTAERTVTAVKAQYNFGVAVPYIVVTDVDFKSSTASASRKAGVRGQEIGATFPMGAVTPFVSVSSATTKVAGATTDKYSGNAFGVDYSLSKRTTAYVLVANYKNKNGAGVQQNKRTLTNVGIRHTF